MSLPAMEWRRIAAVAPAANTIEAFLNAIYTSLQAATYDNGDPRVPGAGSAWTGSRYQNVGVTEAVYATPPLAAVSDLRAIWAGVDAGAPTPKMCAYGGDTFAAGFILSSINKGSGAFNAWDAVNPFTTGDFFGYWRGAMRTTLTISQIQVIESREGIAVFAITNTGAVVGDCLGALFDPLSSDPADAESNGRLYGMSKLAISSNNLGDLLLSLYSTPGVLFRNSAVANGSHTGVFQPGAGTVWACGLQQSYGIVNAPAGTLPSTKAFLAPFSAIKYDVPNYALGELRGIRGAQGLQYGGVVNDAGGVEAGYVVSSNAAGAAGAMAFMKG